MRFTELFTKTRKEAPTDETSKNAQLLIRAGYIHKEMAGVYSYLPLGLRVINNIKRIVGQEMEAIGSTEILMSTLQNKDIWEKTQRWDDKAVDIWFKSNLKAGNEVGFGWSHEEPIVAMLASHISSYKDLPRIVHQFQNKLRNEVRAKSGIIRCREFIMKDMYSFAVDEKTHLDMYEKATEAYLNVYKKMGLGPITHVTSASGGVFTEKFSHEFQTLCDAGEDTIYVHKNGTPVLNEEIFNDSTLAKLGVKKENFDARKAAEVGNIFTFGTKKCEQLGLLFSDAAGNQKPVYLGSYGIGISRLMGVLVEVLADDKGIVWPESVAPFRAHLVALDGGEADADQLYNKLQASSFKFQDVLYDDRSDKSAGEKFADADLIGIPLRLVVSRKSLEKGGIEVKKRTENESKITPLEGILSELELGDKN